MMFYYVGYRQVTPVNRKQTLAFLLRELEKNFKRSNFSDNIIIAASLRATSGNILIRKTETDWLKKHLCQ